MSTGGGVKMGMTFDFLLRRFKPTHYQVTISLLHQSRKKILEDFAGVE